MMFISDKEQKIIDKISEIYNKYPLLQENHIYRIPIPIKVIVNEETGTLEHNDCTRTIAVLSEIKENGCMFSNLYYNEHHCTFYNNIHKKNYSKYDSFFIPYETIDKIYDQLTDTFGQFKDITKDTPFQNTDEYDKLKKINNNINFKENMTVYLFIFLLITVMPINGILMNKYWNNIANMLQNDNIKMFLLLEWILLIVFEMSYTAMQLTIYRQNNKSLIAIVDKIITKKEYQNMITIEKSNLETYETFANKYSAAKLVLHNNFTTFENREFDFDNKG